MSIKINKGQRFGGLTVVEERTHLRLPCGQTNRAFLMKCDCGKTKIIRLSHFIRGKIKTCGHNNHGDSGVKLYNTWRAMKNRVKEDYHQKEYYSDRGITIYSEWNDYKIFREWALKNGYKDGLQIDRINNDGGYSPENCRFATPFVNNHNKRNTVYITYKGKTTSLGEALKDKKMEYHYPAIYSRIKRGWSPDKAISYPIKIGGGRIPNCVARI